MNHRRVSARLALLAAATVMTPVAPAMAQGTAEGASSNDIIVTAQRRAERLEDVPLSITAVQRETLENSGVRNPTDLVQLAPGAQIVRSGSLMQTSVRGITSSTSGWTYENSTALYIDGFYSPDTVSLGNDFSDIQSIQILKGPQGTLYGRNAMAGAIVIETRDPSDHLTANGSLSFGRFNDIRAEGYLSGPISDQIGFAISGYRRHNDGWLRDIGNDPFSKDDDFDAAPNRQGALRGKLKFAPSDQLKVTLGYSYTYSDVPVGMAFQYFDHYGTSATATSPLNPPYRATKLDEVSLNIKTENKVKVQNYTAKVELDTGIGTLTSYTGLNRRKNQIYYDFDGTKSLAFQSISPWDQNTARTFQQTLDYVIDAVDRLNLIVGAFYYRDRTRTGAVNEIGTNADGSPKLNRASTSWLRANAYALYFDATYELGSGLFATGGGRYSHEKRFLAYKTTFASSPPPDLAGKSATFKDFTPHANLRYEIGPRTNIYASYAEGFRSGVFNASPQTSLALVIPLKPEKNKSIEVGFKTAGPNWRFDASAYHFWYTNMQISLISTDWCATPPCAPQTLSANAKAAKGYGIEVQGAWSPVEDFNLRAGLAWNRAYFTDFKNASAVGLNPLGANLNGSNVAQTQDWSGHQLPRAPSITANIGFDYAVAMAGGKLKLASNLTYVSSQAGRDPSLYGPLAGAALADRQRYRENGYVLLNGQINWTEGSDHVTIGVYCNNCTDKRYALYRSGGSTYGDYRVFNEPATYGARIGFKY